MISIQFEDTRGSLYMHELFRLKVFVFLQISSIVDICLTVVVCKSQSVDRLSRALLPLSSMLIASCRKQCVKTRGLLKKALGVTSSAAHSSAYLYAGMLIDS